MLILDFKNKILWEMSCVDSNSKGDPIRTFVLQYMMVWKNARAREKKYEIRNTLLLKCTKKRKYSIVFTVYLGILFYDSSNIIIDSSNGRWGFQSVWVHQSDTRFILRNVLWEWISCIKHPYPSWPRSCTYNPKWKKIKSCIGINNVKEVTFWSGSDKIFSKKIFFYIFFSVFCASIKSSKNARADYKTKIRIGSP